MNVKPDDLCPQKCPGRTPTCHSTCKPYLAFYAENRKKENEPGRLEVSGYLADAWRNPNHEPPRIEKRHRKGVRT